MAEIALGYHTAQITGANLAYATANGILTDYALFDTVENFNPQYEKGLAVFGPTLRGRRGAHVLYKTKTFNLAITNNDIIGKTSEKLAANILVVNEQDLSGFLISFWNATFKYLCRSNKGVFTGLNYVEVYSEQNPFPLEHIDNILYLPLIKLQLKQVEPST
ncbi:MAG: hypothetical protein M1419_08595 [Bacteroidetes bacterium]|nr:hypothetical protein [Bacteroidota bacterium]